MADAFVDRLAEMTQMSFEEFIEADTEYMSQIELMVEEGTNTLYVDFGHVLNYSQVLAESIEGHYIRVEPYLRKVVQHVAKKKAGPDDGASPEGEDKEYWVYFYGIPAVHTIRELKTSKIGTLIALSGTVTRTSEVRPELLYGTFLCMECNNITKNIEQQFKYTEPARCGNPNCGNRNKWQLAIGQSKFIDWQRVRVQENGSDIPSGSMPRTIDVILRHDAVENAKAGDRCVFTGTLIVVPDVSQLSLPGRKVQAVKTGAEKGKGLAMDGVTGLKALGVRDLTYKLCFLACSVQPADAKFGTVNIRDENQDDVVDQLTAEERAEILAMKNDPNLYSNMVKSIAPSVFGHDEIKRGILLMLFGGVHKDTMEGMGLRGDINVCIVGDPSTSKSQFLKYVVSFLPRAVYTSGKASSAAGLTATVAKDPDSGEFNIEAGALMLADNGICCIDEFDKMDPKDQVAIHEAMEQQTISIAKAGIQATLNARTSILAAANPIGGRYDRSKPLKTNLNISPAIMSRFDLFFIVLDECDEASDLNIARHIVKIHQKRDVAIEPVYSTGQLQRFIKFARTIKPIITAESEDLFVEYYRKLRQNDVGSGGKTAYRITVRQLESMVRLTEALARLHCDEEVQPAYVKEAARLLRKSIIHVETEDVDLDPPSRLYMSADAASAKGKENTPKKSPKKKRVPISFEKYKQISDMIVMELRRREMRSVGGGMTLPQIMEWYVESQRENVPDPEDLEREAELVRKIIKRLETVDRVLVVVEEGEGEESTVYVVHPNYVMDMG